MTAHGATFEFAAHRQLLRQVFAAGWAALACVLVLLHAPIELRAPVVIVFFCLVPGMALVGLFNLDSMAVELSLSVALSVALSGLTAGILVYGHLWSPTAVVVIITAISLAGALRDVRFRPRISDVRSPRARPPRALPGNVRRAAVPRLVRRSRTPETRSSSVGGANRPGRSIAAARPSRPTADPTPHEPATVAPVSASPLQRFLLDELRERTNAKKRSPRRQPRLLAQLEPHELSELLSLSSLQRFVTQRAIQEVNPELWFVDDLERRLRPQRLISNGELSVRPPSAPRGVWITGVSARTSIPVAWRVLKGDARKEWRTRLALEMIDALPLTGPGEAVVAAGAAYGSLSGFRHGLEERGLSYLVRIDPIAAAREIAPNKPSRSAAEAREELRKQIDARAGAQPSEGHEPELAVVPGAEHLLLCEPRATGQESLFWLSNLPATTAPERLASLVRLANRSHLERETTDFLRGALEAATNGGAGLDDELALVALARNLQTLGLSKRGAADK